MLLPVTGLSCRQKRSAANKQCTMLDVSSLIKEAWLVKRNTSLRLQARVDFPQNAVFVPVN